MKDKKSNIVEDDKLEIVDNDFSSPDKKARQDLINRAGEEIINKMPDVIDTINDIARINAETDKQVRLIQAEGKKILSEAEAYVKKLGAERDKIKTQGEIIVKTLDKANELLMSANVPDSAKQAYAENLHKWITTIVEQEG
ncbi:hypothetical protein [Fuchsiella alkaliacetigena]|uniref:hypothetical protein n=1 Tax=Fuchsiella alkaliacetigena TaxID=957042 RepID=UPI00200B3875|nr:hypothetical protein [Fuchsiella alkaliacetigena]MCK8825257.1 hypothetical protein [Fuchsiella alkaliacetigena]